MNHKILALMTKLLVILGATLMLWIAYLLFWPTPTLVVKNAPMAIVGPTTVHSGGQITYHYDYCKYYDKPLNIQKDFIDGLIFKTDPIYVSQLESGCHQKDISVGVPETLPTGEYKIRIITQIVINQLRTDTVTYETASFKVINDTE